jgi:TonB family protein
LISYNIKWFLGLSVAVHAAALVALAPTENTVGAVGRTLLLSVNDRSGEAASRPPASAGNEKEALTDAPDMQSQATQPVTAETAPAKHRPVEQSIAQAQPETVVETRADQSPAVQAASTSLSREDQSRHLRASVMEFITGQLNYPAIARSKGWQGVVKLELLIESDGHISDLHIEETSGYALLDKAALDSLQLAHVPDAAQWLDGKAVSIIVPVEYRLVDG